MSVDTHSEGVEGTRYLKFTDYFSNREKKIMREIFGAEYPSVDLTDRNVMLILSKIRQSARVKLNTAQLLPHIKSQYYLLTDSEIADILDVSLTPQEQTLRLIDYLVFKGSYGLGCLYFSLVETSEEMYGLPTHFQLACELKKAIIEGSYIHSLSLTGGFTSAEQETKEAIDGVIAQLDGIVISSEESHSLAESLGIHLQNSLTDLKEVCSIWRKRRSAVCTVEDLVEALVLTRNLGRFTARLCSPGSQHSLVAKNFFDGLGVQWLKIAYYLGYTEAEIATIVGDVEEEDCGEQISLFLEVWQMPDCGPRTITILQKLKFASKVEDVGRPNSVKRQVPSSAPALSLDACEMPNYSSSFQTPSYSPPSSLTLDSTSNGSYTTQRTLLVYQTGGDYGDDYEVPSRVYLVQAKYYRADTDNFDTSVDRRYSNTGPQIEELPSGPVSNTAQYRGQQLQILSAAVNNAKSQSSVPSSESNTVTSSARQLSQQLITSESTPDSNPLSNTSSSGPRGLSSLAHQEITSSPHDGETGTPSATFISQAIPAEDTSSEKHPLVPGITLATTSHPSSLTSFSMSQPETHSLQEVESQPPSQLVSAEGEHQPSSMSELVSSNPSLPTASVASMNSLTAAETQPSSAGAESSLSAITDKTSSSVTETTKAVLASSSDDHPLLVTPKTVTMLHGVHDESSVGARAVSLESMRSRGLEILHDFSQYLIAAALKKHSIEDIISTAEKRGHTELVHFFYQYFFDSGIHCRGGELVGAFLKGFPSPMMFLLLEKLATRDDFESILEDYGLKDFGDQLAMAFHQVSENTDTLPWTGSELLDGMFSSGSVFATVPPSPYSVNTPGSNPQPIPPELLEQLLSQSTIRLRQPGNPPSSATLPATSTSSQPSSISRPEESKTSVVVVSSQPSDAPSDPIDVDSHSDSSEQNSFSNDLNNLDIMDDAPVAAAPGVFSENLALNTWTTEVVQETYVASAVEEDSGIQHSPQTPTTMTTTTTATSTTGSTTTAKTTATSTTATNTTRTIATFTNATTTTTTTMTTTMTTATATTAMTTTSTIATPVATFSQPLPSLAAPYVVTSAPPTSQSQTIDSRVRRENAYNSRLMGLVATAADAVTGGTEAATTYTHSMTQALTTSATLTPTVLTDTLSLSSSGVSTASLSTDDVRVTAAAVLMGEAAVTTHDTATAVSEQPSVESSPLDHTSTTTGTQVVADGSQTIVPVLPVTFAVLEQPLPTPVSLTSTTTSLSAFLGIAETSRTSESTLLHSTSSLAFTLPSLTVTVTSTTYTTSTIAMTTTNSIAMSVAMATVHSTSSATLSTLPEVVSSHSSPLCAVSESENVINGVIISSDSEGSGSDPGQLVKSLSGSLNESPVSSTCSRSVTESAVVPGDQSRPSHFTSNGDGKSARKGSQSSVGRKTRTTKAPLSETRKSAGVPSQADKRVSAKRATGPVGTKPSSQRTGSVRVPLPAKQPIKDSVCKSHAPLRSSSSTPMRTRLKGIEHTKKEELTFPERSRSKSSHLLAHKSSKISPMGSLSTSSEELFSRQQDGRGNVKTSSRERAMVRKPKTSVAPGFKNGRPKSASQDSLHSTTMLQTSKAASGSKRNPRPGTTSGVVNNSPKPSQNVEVVKSVNRGMKGATSSERLSKTEDSGSRFSLVSASSHNSVTSSPRSEHQYSHLAISDSSESEAEIDMSSQFAHRLSLSATSSHSLDKDSVTISVEESRSEKTVSEIEPPVSSEADPKTLPDLSEPPLPSRSAHDTSLPLQMRTEQFEQQHDEMLSCQIQNSSDIFKTLAMRLHNWKMVGRYLMLEDEDLQRISLEYKFTAEQAYQMLVAWMEKNPGAATYSVLIESLRNSLREDLVMEVVQAAKLSQRGLVVQIREDNGAVAFNTDLPGLWRTVQPLVDRWTKEGYSQVEVSMRFRK